MPTSVIADIGDKLVHRSGCHRWHSCPSDRGTYTCGDKGYCSACPDNQYCENRKPRVQTDPSPRENVEKPRDRNTSTPGKKGSLKD